MHYTSPSILQRLLTTIPYKIFVDRNILPFRTSIVNLPMVSIGGGNDTA